MDVPKPDVKGVELNKPTVLTNQVCPVCKKNTLTVAEYSTEVPHFGNAYVFSVRCSNCGFNVSDVEFENAQEPVKWTFTPENEKDLNALVVKSSQATVKIGNFFTMEPGVGDGGFITTVEGLLLRIKQTLTDLMESEEDKDEKKKIWAKIKSLNKILWLESKAKIVIKDPSGNSAIVSDKAIKSSKL